MSITAGQNLATATDSLSYLNLFSWENKFKLLSFLFT